MKSKTPLLIGSVAIGGLLLYSFSKTNNNSTTGGGGGFTVTKPATGSSSGDTYVTNYTIPSPSLSFDTSSSDIISSETKKASNFSTGKIQVADGIYTNPAKGDNIFNPNVPTYTDDLGQGVSYAPTKKQTSTPKTSFIDKFNSIGGIKLF